MENLQKLLLNDAKKIQAELVAHRRYFHQNPELHLDLPVTKDYVVGKLKEMGYDPIDCGKSGVIALAGGKQEGKCFLIRGDMDALPICEETDEPFKSENGAMHACGHDLHTANMLGAAKLLKQYEENIQGTVKLMFQPAEETLSGAKEMIEQGLLENPKVDAAMMIHVVSAMPIKTGQAIVMAPGIGSAASDLFEIHIQGKGGHGAMPHLAVDPINVAAHIIIALQSINSREAAASDGTVLTVGMMKAGETSNVIPDTAVLQGTLRTFNPNARAFAKQRITEIADLTAKTFRAEAETKYSFGCPSIYNDAILYKKVIQYTSELLGAENAIKSDSLENFKMSGSEDFGYVTEKIPGLMVILAAGNSEEGYTFPLHHPKVRFDEDALQYGAAVYAYTAMRWLEEN